MSHQEAHNHGVTYKPGIFRQISFHSCSWNIYDSLSFIHMQVGFQALLDMTNLNIVEWNHQNVHSSSPLCMEAYFGCNSRETELKSISNVDIGNTSWNVKKRGQSSLHPAVSQETLGHHWTVFLHLALTTSQHIVMLIALQRQCHRSDWIDSGHDV